MVLYNIKLTIRRLLKEKVFSSINIFGLVIGITSFLVLFLYVSNEKSFDKHFEGHENIYRVTSIPEGRENSPWARSLGMIYTASAEIPEIELATQFSHCSVGTIRMGENSFQQNSIMSVDDAFIKMFEVEAKIGDLSELNKPNTLFISEDFAKKHFNGEDPIGKTIDIKALQYFRDLGEYEIRGIVKNCDPKTHFKYELLISQNGGLSRPYRELDQRKTHWTYNYFKLKKGSSPKLVANKVKAYFETSSLKESRGPKEYNFYLFPLDDIHLKSDFRFELRESSSKINIALFVTISLVILLISLLNFTNLTLAKLIKRSKELGLKKAIGANTRQIMLQIFTEVIFVCILAIGVSLLSIEIVKPFINQIFEIEFDIYYSNPVVYLTIIGVLFVSLGITALFVILFLFRKNTTIDILSERNSYSGNYLLKLLLIGQVTTVIILMSGTFLVNKQINYILNKPLGFTKDNVVVLHLKNTSKDPSVFVKELEKESQILNVGMAAQHFYYPSQDLPLDDMGIDGSAAFVFANFNYLKTMNIKLLENWITPGVDTVHGMIINNHLYKRLMEKHGTMEKLDAFLESETVVQEGEEQIPIIGVTEDFNYNSAHDAIGDFAFFISESNNRGRFIHIRLNSENIHSGMEAIKTVWKNHYPQQPLNYFFIDDKIAQQYKAETILSRILFAFSAIGILISIIGISALSLFISQQRTKEIGIRKVNGAKVSEILALLNKSFIKWVLIASVIACPIAYFSMSKWLENFAYKTSLSWWVFAVSCVLVLIITLLIVSLQSWRTARRNPVESLRDE